MLEDWLRIIELRRKAKQSINAGHWLRLGIKRRRRSKLSKNVAHWLIPGKVGFTACEVVATDDNLDWQSYIDIADTFKVKAKYQDREDLKAEIIIRMADIANRNGEPLSKPSMLRIASYVSMEYWHSFNRNSKMTSLNVNIEDDEGNAIELYQTLADDRAIDLDDWQDAKTWRIGCPKQLVNIAYKKLHGKALTANERKYLSRYREKELKKAQKALL